MKIILHKDNLPRFTDNEKNLGFVPTMGGIHIGHTSLIKRSIKECEKTIVSIFVNKPQFNNNNDFKKYPRILKKDINKLKKLNVDFLFLPSAKQIYPNGLNKNIKISSFQRKLCGKNRPGHFKAIADVIDRFIKIIHPKRIYFGEKDMQQLKIIDHFIKKNYPYIKVVPCKTIREKNDIACSSRNFLLSSEEKNVASKVFNLLVNKKKETVKKKFLLRKLRKEILNLGVKKIDYIELLDINKLIKPYKKKEIYKFFIAYYLGSTRLIDNI